MKIYHYTADTHEFVGVTDAKPDPKEKGRFLIPANATDIPPPDRLSGVAAVFGDAGWSQVPDSRGVAYYDENGIETVIDKLGEEVPVGMALDPRPSRDHILVDGEWIAPTQAELDAKWRATAFTTRTKFCLAAKRLGILTPDEAVLAAQGGWPQSFVDALSTMPAGIDADDAQIVWAATTEVHRNDPVLDAVANAKGLTPEQTDALFQ